MRVLMTGASGLIGGALTTDLESRGDVVTRLVRRDPRNERERRWDPEALALATGELEGFDAVVHLAGDNLARGRWTPEKKARIWNSRVGATRLLAEGLARTERPPRVLISSSAVGYYGDRGDERLTEESGPGRGFLAELAVAWEGATATAAARMRVVHLRTALVLAARGGGLERMVPIFRLGLGGPLGDGRAWWSWIAIDDLVAAVRFAIERETVSGAINASSPSPIPNAGFARTLGHVLGRPALLAAPAFALRIAFGEMADAMLLASQRAEPLALANAGFEFRFPELEPALRHVLQGSRPGTSKPPLEA